MDPGWFVLLPPAEVERTVWEDGFGVGRSVEGKGSAGEPLQRRRDRGSLDYCKLLFFWFGDSGAESCNR